MGGSNEPTNYREIRHYSPTHPPTHLYKPQGINRVSVGVQSFNQTLLTAAGRAHRYSPTPTPPTHPPKPNPFDPPTHLPTRSLADVHAALKLLKAANKGTLNYSLDLISGLPYQVSRWVVVAASLHILTTHPPTHLHTEYGAMGRQLEGSCGPFSPPHQLV